MFYTLCYTGAYHATCLQRPPQNCYSTSGGPCIGTSIKTDILRSKILQNIELQNRVESQLQQVVLNMCPCPAPKAVLYSFKQLSCVTQHHQIWALVQNIATAERKTVLCRFEKFFFDIPIFKRFSVDTNL